VPGGFDISLGSLKHQNYSYSGNVLRRAKLNYRYSYIITTGQATES